MKRVFTSLLLVGSFSLVNAQTAFEKAKYLYEDENYTDAAVAFTKFAEKTSRENVKAEAYAKAGNSYYYTHKYAEAEKSYKQASDLGYKSGEFFMNYGNLKMSNGDYPTAIKWFEKAKAADNSLEVLANAKIQACISAQDKTDIPTMVIHKNAEGLNTKYNEFGLNKFGDKYMLSTSRKATDDAATDKKSGQGFSSLYLATNNGGSWSVQSPTDSMFKAFNTGTFTYHESTQTAYFTVCGQENGKAVPCKIYSSKYSGTWTKPEPLNINSETHNTAQPAISADGKTLYFSSDREGGLGNKDIYKASLGANGTWMEPVNLGREVNSAGDEVFPVTSGDSLLIFSSDGRNGIGGLDLYKSPVSRGVVRKATWMEMPFNSTGDDFNLVFGKTTSEGFYCSNRPGGMGGDDIYSFNIDERLFGAGGDVREKGTQKAIAGALVVITGSDGSKTELKSDNNGVFSMPEASPFVDYIIQVSKSGYFNTTQTLTAIKPGDNAEAKLKERNNVLLSLSKTPNLNEEIRLENIYFEYDKADLTTSSKQELMSLVKLLRENPGFDIIINSHSDEQGEDKYNLELSHRRAQTVVDFLVTNGITRARLTAKGWGESNPVIKNATSEDQHAANRRTTFQITNPTPKPN